MAASRVQSFAPIYRAPWCRKTNTVTIKLTKRAARTLGGLGWRKPPCIRYKNPLSRHEFYVLLTQTRERWSNEWGTSLNFFLLRDSVSLRKAPIMMKSVTADLRPMPLERVSRRRSPKDTAYSISNYEAGSPEVIARIKVTVDCRHDRSNNGVRSPRFVRSLARFPYQRQGEPLPRPLSVEPLFAAVFFRRCNVKASRSVVYL